MSKGVRRPSFCAGWILGMTVGHDATLSFVQEHIDWLEPAEELS